MSLTKRKPRPLTRETQDYRDDRLFLIGCDDRYAPPQYFGFHTNVIKRVKIVVEPTEDGTSNAGSVITRLKNCESKDYDEKWVLLDIDHCTQNQHIKTFTNALKEAREAGINIALSNACFEVWLLLHHVDPNSLIHLKNANEAEQLLKSTLGGYNKTRLQCEHFPLEFVVSACYRAKVLDEPHKKNPIPNAVTTQVYRLWESIVHGSSLAQLPQEFHEFKQSLSGTQESSL